MRANKSIIVKNCPSIKPYVHSPIMHGYTYSGHPVACAAAIANLQIVESEKLPSNAATVGIYFLEKLMELKKMPLI